MTEHPALVPELLVESVAASTDFWCGLCGFEVLYEPICSSLREAGWSLFMEPETKWYRTGAGESGVEQFLVTDPDGYLLRFQASLGRR